MEHQTQTTADGMVIRLAGRLTYDDHDAFRQLMDTIETQPGLRIILDLSALAFIDSAGLGMLVVARDLAARKSMMLFRRGDQGVVKSLMDLIDFDAVVPPAG